MARDPFLDDDNDADEAQAETPRRRTTSKPAPKTVKKSTKEAAVAETETNGNSKLSVTVKGGSAFDAPWLVFYFDSVAEALEVLEDDADAVAQLAERTVEVASFFVKKAAEKGVGKAPAKSGGSGGSSSGGGSRGGSKGGYSKGGNGGGRSGGGRKKTGPPADFETPICDHDEEMVWREGETKSGKAFAGFYCQGTDDWDEQCKPVYPN